MPKRSRAAPRSAEPVPAGTGRPLTSHRGPSRPSIGNARNTRRAAGASTRFVIPRWLSASVSTIGIPRLPAASPTGPAT